jgi:2'-5' RNA ligase superfamily
MNSRDQLTLFVPPSDSTALDAVRQVLDPIQAELIKAHVTLCREDELAGATSASIRARLGDSEVTQVTLRFGAPERFNDHGILLPCIDGELEFQALRQVVLGKAQVRRQIPHITLAHPRNPRASANTLENALSLGSGRTLIFDVITRIRQRGSSSWQSIEEYPLVTHRSSSSSRP